jgi:hypothetical protein
MELGRIDVNNNTRIRQRMNASSGILSRLPASAGYHIEYHPPSNTNYERRSMETDSGIQVIIGGSGGGQAGAKYLLKPLYSTNHCTSYFVTTNLPEERLV